MPQLLIKIAEEPVMKSRMTLTSKCQLVLHFLLFTLTILFTGVHNHTEGSFHISAIVTSYTISCNWEEIEKATNAFWLLVERMEAHYWETVWTLAVQAIHLESHEAHYPFGGTRGQGTTTCLLQSPQQDLQNCDVRWDSTWQSFAIVLFVIWPNCQEEMRKMPVTIILSDWWL